MRTSRAHLEWEGKRLSCAFPYDPEVVGELKDAIPGWARLWMPERRCWSIHKAYADEIQTLLERFFDEVVIEGSPASEPASADANAEIARLQAETVRLQSDRDAIAAQLAQVQRGLSILQDENRRLRQQGQPAGTTPAHAVLFLLSGAPADLVQAAYRVLAQRYHPDHGGRHEQMVALNRAYDELRGRGNR